MKIGDQITAIFNYYGVVNTRGIYKVVGYPTKGFITVQILSHKDFPQEIGEIYTVAERYFKLVETPQEEVIRKIAHLRKLFENRKQEYKPYGI